MTKSLLHKTNPVIVISRTDNIGDVVLTLPLATYLRKKYPQGRILFLAKGYLKPLIDSCESIDAHVDVDELSDLPETFMQVKFLKDLNADVIINVSPNHEVAWLSKKAEIPLRIGTGHRSYHWLYCNKLVNFSRKRSTLHEAQLNFKLAECLGLDIPEFEELKTAFALTRLPKFEHEEILDKNKFNLILHPKSRGSGREWPIDHYSTLVDILPKEKFKIFVTGTEAEGKLVYEGLLKNHPDVVDMTGKQDFAQLLAFISRADGLVASGTGPLHMAAALGRKAIGIFPPLIPVHPGRWKPLGPDGHFLVLDKDCTDCKGGGACTCMQAITAQQVKALLDNK